MKAPASPPKKVCDENERKKTTAVSKKFCERKDFVRPYLKTG